MRMRVQIAIDHVWMVNAMSRYHMVVMDVDKSSMMIYIDCRFKIDDCGGDVGCGSIMITRMHTALIWSIQSTSLINMITDLYFQYHNQFNLHHLCTHHHDWCNPYHHDPQSMLWWSIQSMPFTIMTGTILCIMIDPTCTIPYPYYHDQSNTFIADPRSRYYHDRSHPHPH